MKAVLETTATADDARHLTLDQPLEMAREGPVKVFVVIGSEEAPESEPRVIYPPGWSEKTPEQRAKDIRAWCDSHTDGVGLSDWAVSRDSIYD